MDGYKEREERYLLEIENFLSDIEKAAGNIKIDYFLKLTEEYFLTQKTVKNGKKRLFVLGNEIPEEFFYALKIEPVWCLGGSLANLELANTKVPRDTDAVSQSILGYLDNEMFVGNGDFAVLIPMINDSMRKIEQILLSRKIEVIAVDLPCIIQGDREKELFVTAIENMVRTLECSFRTKFSMKNLRKAFELSIVSHTNFQKFYQDNVVERSKVSGILAMFLANTYYYETNHTRWNEEIQKLSTMVQELEILPDSIRVSLLGSPVIIPNYKIPFLLEDSKMSVVHTYHTMCRGTMNNYLLTEQNQKKFSWKRLFTREQFVEEIIWDYYHQLYTSRYLDHVSTEMQMRHAMQKCKIDGVVYIVLKGQIGYDFDLAYVEALCTEYHLPLIRLETDYFNHDSEQLRIRMDAFHELLTFKARKGGRDV